jgi:hypothetical protein
MERGQEGKEDQHEDELEMGHGGLPGGSHVPSEMLVIAIPGPDPTTPSSQEPSESPHLGEAGLESGICGIAWPSSWGGAVERDTVGERMEREIVGVRGEVDAGMEIEIRLERGEQGEKGEQGERLYDY